jgi:hypothetical protein
VVLPAGKNKFDELKPAQKILSWQESLIAPGRKSDRQK